MLISALVVAALMHVLPPELRHKTAILLFGQFFGYALLFLVLYLVLRLHYGRPFWTSLRWTPSDRVRDSHALVMGVGVAVATALMGVVLRTPEIDTPMKQLVLADRTSLLLVLLVGTTIGPLAEELAFRGFLQPLFVRTFGAAAGIFLAAVPFGLLHLQQYAWSWRHALLVTLAGAAFGWMRYVSGSTRTTTFMHATYNATFFLALLGNRKEIPTTW
jgi:membrane protease YdiL (CAAX protease family)